VKFGDVPTNKDHDFELKQGVLEIRSSDNRFHRSGRYFLSTRPDTDIISLIQELMGEKDYTFQLSWRADNVVPYIHSQGVMDVVTNG
jgi:hypothetical protein